MAGPDHGNSEMTPDTAKAAPRGTSRRRVRRPAGPPAADGTAAQSISVSTGPRANPSAPRKTAPIKQIRRKKSAPVATRPIVSADTTSSEASPQRSGAAMSYRERRRAGSSGDAAGRVVTTRADRSRLGVALAAVVAVVLVVGLVVASVLFAMGTNRIDDRAAQRAQYSAFARQMIVNLTSLSPTTIDQVTNTFETKTSGKALEQLQQSLQQTTDLVKSQGVTTKGTILSDAVVDSDADSATVMLVSGWTMNTPPPAAGAAAPPTDQGPVVQTFRWKLSITMINGDMKMTDIEWVT
ncbi:Mce-associated membrane protein [Williamsia maris]|uniref:Mce-associated membrane protein n=2 Tax=Williamsia maris TaxID=72806 RepID=A0ABT1HI06_9NOCA|nr:Mce-associated membrane protein [Williamsia maris]